MVNRRRFLQLSASAIAGVASVHPANIVAAAGDHGLRLYVRQGRALGAQATMQLYHYDEAQAQAIMESALSEVARLESILSLYDKRSELSRLNQYGAIENPSPELVEILSTAKQYSALTDGKFDVTIQPVWRWVDRHFARYPGIMPNQSDMERQLEWVGYEKLVLEKDHIAFKQKAMGITLNGIAQGYITDKVTQYLQQQGCHDVLVNMGEFYAAGRHADGRPWKVGVESAQDRSAIYKVQSLHNQAMASSAAYGYWFDLETQSHHLLDPHRGLVKGDFSAVTVIAPDAMTADAVSTAAFLMDRQHVNELQSAIPMVDILTQA